jgi:acetyl-CoA decarbonylase/synthase complex subunit beta
VSMFKDIPVEVGVIYEGQRIRWQDAQLELGGPRFANKFELVKVRGLDEVEDGKFTIIGQDLKDLKPGASYPFGILVEVAGKQVEPELEGVIERRIHGYSNYIEGFMHLNQRYDIQLRLSKKSFEKGLNSFTIIGKILQRLFKSELPIIQKVQITFYTDPSEVKKVWDEAMATYEIRDAKARGMKDEEADAFYGCTLCQSFAPTHCCVITPQRYSNCGAISWFDGRASARVDPKGPVFEIKKGELLDPEKGEFSGVNQAVKDKSLGEIGRVWLYTAFGYPHTSCGCFEGVAFYIPEVDGLGIVHRDFKGQTVNGLAFSTLADSTAGGRQVDGFHGISIEYMRSRKFLSADGGWDRIVWMPSVVKERVKEFIPKELIDRIATDSDVQTVDQLKVYLTGKSHPIVERWKVEEAKPVAAEAAPAVQETAQMPFTGIPMEGIAFAGGMGFKLILKDAKIVAKRVIIRSTSKGG